MTSRRRTPTEMPLPEVQRTLAELRDLRDDMALRRVWSSVAFPEVDGLARSAAMSWQRQRSPFRRLAWWTGGLATVAVASAAAIWIAWPSWKAHHAGPLANAGISGRVDSEAATKLPSVAGAAIVRGGAAVHAGKKSLPVALPGGATATLAPGSTVKVDDDGRLLVIEGGSRFDVPVQTKTLVVQAGAYRVVVAGTRFRVDLAPGSQAVNVAVESGTAEIFAVDAPELSLAHLAPGSRWSSVSQTSPAASTTTAGTDSPAISPEPAMDNGTFRVALGGPRRKHRASTRIVALPERNHEIAEEAPSADGIAAENAAYERGKNQRDVQHRPELALRTWRDYRQEHPNGILRPEVDLSIFETLARTRDVAGAIAEGSAFLSRYPDSERRSEVARLVGDLHRSRGDCKRAVESYDLALASHLRGDAEDHVAFQRASCLLQAPGDGGASLQKYIDSHPAGRYRRTAIGLLSSGARAP